MASTGRRPLPPVPLAAITGPTASGKSGLAMAIAQRLPVEILVADSRQVYRGMDIGTAKPTAAERAAVPHHLLDLADPDERFTVADWVRRARELIPQIGARGRLPLVVGGTGLYLAALVDGYNLDHPPPGPEVRAQLSAELEASGLASLAARLVEVDPAQAKRTDLHNPRRVLRALERASVAGGPVTVAADPYPGRIAMIGISRPRDELIARIEARAHRMFTSGLLDEVASLLGDGYGPELPPMSGHGYREAAAELSGRSTRDQALADTILRTRQYARRQMTWLRRDRRIVWLTVGEREADDLDIVSRAELLLRRLLD